jgi:hypothetical protein
VEDGEAAAVPAMPMTPPGRSRSALAAMAAALAVAALAGATAGSGSTASESRAAATATISVRTAGAQGVVVSVPRGISCPDACRASFRQGSVLTLVAGSGPGSRLVRWGGGCVGSAAMCQLVAERSTSVTATFARAEIGIGGALKTRYPVSVTVAGPGRVVSSPSGIVCPPSAQCEKTFDKGTRVTLRAVPTKRGYTPSWTGILVSCPAGPSCDVRVDTNVDLSTTFRRKR